MSAALLCGYFYPSSLPIGIHNYSMIAELSGRSFFSYTLFLHRPDTGQEETRVDPGHLTFESLLKTCNSFEDDLSLGAEATGLHDLRRPSLGRSPVLLPPPKSCRKTFTTSTPQQKLTLPLFNMGQSMASSCLSSATSKTASSISEVLQMCSEDAEETLYHLGFGCDEPQVTARIPSRFFNFPSQLHGINFRLFLESQLRRVSQEDPNLSLASRFRQVEVLTTMANAFYSLYSHVSRTPLQKLAPPEFSFSPAAEKRIGVRFFSSVRSEPRSPVERLKDTVSKMCLYTGTRASESTSPHNSPRKRNSIPEIATQLVNTDTKTLEHSGLEEDKNVGLVDTNMGCATYVDLETEIETGESPEGGSYEDMTPQAGLDSTEHSSTLFSELREASQAPVSNCRVRLSFSDPCQTQSAVDDTNIPEDSGEKVNTVTHNSERPVTPKPQSHTLQTPMVPVHKVTRDIICPPIVEQVHKAPYCSAQDFRTSVPHYFGRQPVSDISTRSPSEANLNSQGDPVTIPKICSEHYSGDGESPSPSPHPSMCRLVSPCQILVTGWDGDSTHGDAAEDVPPSSHSGSTQPQARLPDGVWRNRRYLRPTKGADQAQLSLKPKQANSFELEEVHSAGEDDVGQSESRTLASLCLSAVGLNKSLPPRGDSFQSDSSGYAEEDSHLLA
ncbi:protein ITPRID2 isoform X2 [Clupea harengus]|uniref:Protein ITPRID2 isoform X2 n=1 Tax=Clupea harengus TaxID=7950 RepID=A0A8M1KIQ0_CLUHA|nr:protein ITPRID2 isoform X2 [Clupea harengus]